MKKMKKNFAFALVSLFLMSCGPTIYLAPSGKQIAASHRTVAIMPPSVSIAASRKMSADAMKEAQNTESVNFQQEIYAFMLKRKGQGKFFIDIQDVETTNALIAKATQNGEILTTSDFCELLKVDGLITSNFAMSKPMSTGAAAALYIVAGGIGATNTVTTTLSIKDCQSSSLIWKYDYKYSGGLGSSAASLVEGLMRNASNKMPYRLN
jgi:hypothetical protein